jgi:hypothetical protein
MNRPATWLAILLLLGIGSIAFAQEPDVPPATTRVERKSRTWTNEDLEKLTGSVNVVGSDDAAPKPAEKTHVAQKEEDNCESYAWVAAVIGVLREQGVSFAPRFWPERLFGDTCANNVSVSAVAARIDGDYTLDNGAKVHLSAVAAPGLPNAAEIVNSVGEHRALIVKWKGQPLVMTKVDYIDRQYNYVSNYSIASLMLTNVLTGRVLIFDTKTDSPKEIEGTLELKAERRP